MELRCACGASFPRPEKVEGPKVPCPTCKAPVDIPAEVPAPPASKSGLVAALIVVIIACVGYLIYRLSQKEEETPKGPDAAALYQEAVRLYQAQDLRGAIEKLEQAVTADPMAYDAQYLLGRCLRQIGQNRRAIEPLSRTLEARPTDLNVRTEYASALWGAGFRAETIKALEEVLSKQADHPAAMRLLAEAYLYEDQLDRSHDLYKALAEKSSYADVLSVTRLHRVLLYQGKHDDARAVAEKARTSFTGSARTSELAIMEAVYQHDTGHPEKTLAPLDGALAEMRPGTPEWMGLMRLRTQMTMENGDYEAVLAHAARVLDRPKVLPNMVYHADAALQRVEALLLLGRLEEARSTAGQHLREFNLQTDSIRDMVMSLGLVIEKVSREEYLKFVESLPKRARNDFLAFLAILERAEKKEALFKEDIQKASEATVGMNYPHFLIQKLKP